MVTYRLADFAHSLIHVLSVAWQSADGLSYKMMTYPLADCSHSLIHVLSMAFGRSSLLVIIENLPACSHLSLFEPLIPSHHAMSPEIHSSHPTGLGESASCEVSQSIHLIVSAPRTPSHHISLLGWQDVSQHVQAPAAARSGLRCFGARLRVGSGPLPTVCLLPGAMRTPGLLYGSLKLFLSPTRDYKQTGMWLTSLNRET